MNIRFATRLGDPTFQEKALCVCVCLSMHRCVAKFVRYAEPSFGWLDLDFYGLHRSNPVGLSGVGFWLSLGSANLNLKQAGFSRDGENRPTLSE